MAKPFSYHDHISLLISKIKNIIPTQDQKRKREASPKPKPNFDDLNKKLKNLCQKAAAINKRPDWIPNATTGLILIGTVKHVSSALYPEPSSVIRLSPSNVNQIIREIDEFATDVTRRLGMNNTPPVNKQDFSNQNNDTRTEPNIAAPSPKPSAQSNEDKTNQKSQESSQTMSKMTEKAFMEAATLAIAAHIGIPPEVSKPLLDKAHKEGANKAEQQAETPSMGMGMGM